MALSVTRFGVLANPPSPTSGPVTIVPGGTVHTGDLIYISVGLVKNASIGGALPLTLTDNVSGGAAWTNIFHDQFTSAFMIFATYYKVANAADASSFPTSTITFAWSGSIGVSQGLLAGQIWTGWAGTPTFDPAATNGTVEENAAGTTGLYSTTMGGTSLKSSGELVLFNWWFSGANGGGAVFSVTGGHLGTPTTVDLTTAPTRYTAGYAISTGTLVGGTDSASVQVTTPKTNQGGLVVFYDNAGSNVTGTGHIALAGTGTVTTTSGTAVVGTGHVLLSGAGLVQSPTAFTGTGAITLAGSGNIRTPSGSSFTGTGHIDLEGFGSIGTPAQMTYPLRGSFAQAGGQDGATAVAYLASRFGGQAPPLGTPPPVGAPDSAPVVTDDSFGAPGSYVLQVPQIADYVVLIQFGDPVEQFWQLEPAGNIGNILQNVGDFQIGTGSGPGASHIMGIGTPGQVFGVLPSGSLGYFTPPGAPPNQTINVQSITAATTLSNPGEYMVNASTPFTITLPDPRTAAVGYYAFHRIDSSEAFVKFLPAFGTIGQSAQWGFVHQTDECVLYPDAAHAVWRVESQPDTLGYLYFDAKYQQSLFGGTNYSFQTSPGPFSHSGAGADGCYLTAVHGSGSGWSAILTIGNGGNPNTTPGTNDFQFHGGDVLNQVTHITTITGSAIISAVGALDDGTGIHPNNIAATWTGAGQSAGQSLAPNQAFVTAQGSNILAAAGAGATVGIQQRAQFVDSQISGSTPIAPFDGRFAYAHFVTPPQGFISNAGTRTGSALEFNLCCDWKSSVGAASFPNLAWDVGLVFDTNTIQDSWNTRMQNETANADIWATTNYHQQSATRIVQWRNSQYSAAQLASGNMGIPGGRECWAYWRWDALNSTVVGDGKTVIFENTPTTMSVRRLSNGGNVNS